jgi:hypothetical protein
MSAKYNPNDGFFVAKGKIDSTFESYVEGLFDYSVECDITEIKKAQKEKKALFRLCLVKTLIFPLEATLGFFLLGTKFVKKLTSQQRKMWGFMRGKVTFKEFKKTLS